MKYLTKVIIDGCKGGEEMTFEAKRLLKKAVDSHGVPVDCVWHIKKPGSHTRIVRLYDGNASLSYLLNLYSFVDENGCSYSGNPSASSQRNLLDTTSTMGMSVKVLPSHEGSDEKGEYRASSTSTSSSFGSSSSESRTAREVRGHELPPMATKKEAAAALLVGVPQRLERSGNCWFSSLCFLLLRSLASRSAFLHHLKRSDEHRRTERMWRSCIQDPSVAEELRLHMYRELGLGDKPGIPPEEEGQNGFSMLQMLLYKIGAPMRLLLWEEKEENKDNKKEEEKGAGGRLVPYENSMRDSKGKQTGAHRKERKDEPCFLGIRVHRGKHRPPMVHLHKDEEGGGGTRRYEMVGFMCGSEHCGHQISVSKGERLWHFADSDAGRNKIGPISFGPVDGEGEFWKAMEYVLPHSNRTMESKYCDMSPLNRSPLHVPLQSIRSEGSDVVSSSSGRSVQLPEERNRGMVNVDYLYVSPAIR